MLMQIRERASGIFAYIIVALLAIPFALWGIHEYLGGPSDQKVAEVNGEEITKRLFDAQLQDQRRYLRSMLGSSFDSLYRDENTLKQNVLDTLIQNALLGEEIKSAGYRISDRALAQRIQAVPQFNETGVFSAARYEQLLAMQGRTPSEFEEQLRQEESINQYQGSAVYSSFLPLQYKQQYARLKKQQRDFDYITLSQNPEAIEVSEQEVTSYYEANKQSFMSMERVKLAYLEIKQQQVADAMLISPDEVRDTYNADPARFQSAELRQARHILFKVEDDAAEEEFVAAFEKARTAEQRIKNGESFADVAKAVSEDSLSANNGGNLGFLARNDIDNPQFMDTLFSLEEGETSSPVRTSQGVQLIRLEAITLPKMKSFEEVRDQIENELKAEASDKEFLERAEQLANLSYVNEDNLVAAANELDMSVQTSDWITEQTSEGIASYPAVVNAAFSDDVLNKGLNSALLEVSDGHVMVVRVAEHEPAQVQRLEDVANEIRASIKRKKAREILLAKGNEIIDQLENNQQSFTQIANKHNTSLLSAGAMQRDDDSAPAELVERVFSIASHDASLPIFEGMELSDGSFAIIRINEIIDIEPQNADIEQPEWISLQGRYGRREMSAMIKALRETGDVKVYPENL